MPELSEQLSQQLIEDLDSTITLRRGMDDRSTEVHIEISTAWDARDIDEADGELLARHVSGEPDEDGSLSAQVAALHGYLFDMFEPDVVDQADEISELSLAIVAQLDQDGDTVLVLEVADWYPPFDSAKVAQASLALTDRALSGLCDRMAYGLGDHLRLVPSDDTEPPVLERPASWWVTRGWRDLGNEIVVRSCEL